MRLILKFLIAVFIIITTLFYIKKDFSNKILKFDKDLQEFLSCFGLNRRALVSSFKQTVKKPDKKYFYIGKVYTVRADFPLRQFESNFGIFLKKQRFGLKKENYGAKSENIKYEINFKGYKVYTLCLERKPESFLALVVDDWGYNPNVILYLKEIKIPLNIAILPNLRYSRTVNKIAQQNGHEVLLHLPMQPLETENMEQYLEKITIRENMKDIEIENIVIKFINELNNIKGINNHMGSLISKNEGIMSVILKIVKERNLYYLDSKVTPDSVAPDLAKKIKIKCFERDIFIDKEENSDYIKNQIRKAIKLAQAKGHAIAIGHAKKMTLEAIKEMLPQIKEKTYPIKLSELK